MKNIYIIVLFSLYNLYMKKYIKVHKVHKNNGNIQDEKNYCSILYIFIICTKIPKNLYLSITKKSIYDIEYIKVREFLVFSFL